MKCKPYREANLGPKVCHLVSTLSGQPCLGFCSWSQVPWLFPGFTAPSHTHFLEPTESLWNFSHQLPMGTLGRPSSPTGEKGAKAGRPVCVSDREVRVGGHLY